MEEAERRAPEYDKKHLSYLYDLGILFCSFEEKFFEIYRLHK